MDLNIGNIVGNQSIQGVNTDSNSDNELFGTMFKDEMGKRGIEGRTQMLNMRLEHLTELQTKLNSSDLTVEEKEKYASLIDKIMARIQERLDKMEEDEMPKDLLAFLMQIITQMGFNPQVTETDSEQITDLDLALLDTQESPLLQSNDSSTTMFTQFQAMMSQSTFRPPQLTQAEVDEMKQDMTMLKELKEKLA